MAGDPDAKLALEEMEPVLKYKFDEFEADVRAAELHKNGTRLRLQMQPFQILLALLERPREVVTREELRERLWPGDTFVDFDHGLNTAVAKLRDALGDSASKPKYIETVAKRGYRFLGDALELSGKPDVAVPVAIAEPQAIFTGVEPNTVPSAPPEQRSVRPLAAESELPRADRRTVKILFILSQIMYLSFYFSALFDWEQLYKSSFTAWHGAGYAAFVAYLVTALAGVAVRLYLVTATAFDYHLLESKYRLIFPALFMLDMWWALSPLLIADRIGLGLALGATAALIYMPFAQRVLVRIIHQSAAQRSAG